MKKAIKVILIVILLLIVVLFTLPFIFKDKIVEKVKTEINNNVNAKVNFGSFDLGIFSSFPDFTFSIHDLSVIGINDFDNDTLAFIKSLSLRVDLMSVITGSQLKIKSVDLDKSLISLLVHKDGKANWDIAKPSTDTTSVKNEPSKFKVALKHYSITGSEVRYDDQSLTFKMTMYNLNHNGSGDFTQDLFTLVTQTSIDKASLWYGGVKYISEAKTDLKAELEMDMAKSKYTFKQNELNLNELALGFDGYMAMPGNDIEMDLKFNTKKADFRTIVSLIPGAYSESFKDLKSSGTLALDGYVKGIYNDKNMPGYGVNVKIQNGMFQYTSLPMAVNNVQVDLKVNNPDGVTDHTIIDLKKMHIELGTEPFDARIYVSTPVSDANFDLMVKGKINLGDIKNFMPLEKGTDLNGILTADLTAKGRMSAIEQKKYEEINASGSLALSGMNYKSDAFPQGVAINQFMLTFNPRNITLNNCDVKIGKSDIKANGTLNNLLAYYFKKETLNATLNLNSNLLDINEMMGNTTATTSAATDTSKMTVIEIPSNIDFNMNASIGKILYDNMIIQDMKGNINLYDQTLTMNNTGFNMLDGSVKMNGSYATKNVKSPDINYTLSVSDLDIQKTFKTFNTVQKMAPIAEHCSGKFSTALHVTGKLDDQMSPMPNSLDGGGTLKTGNVVLSNFEPVNKLADELKMEEYKKLDLNNVNFTYEFKDGRVNIKPFETSLEGTKAKIEGSNGFDMTIDYKISLFIPKSKLPPQAMGVMNNLFASANKSLGTNFSLPDPVPVKVSIGGTVTKPVIKTGLKDGAGSITESIKTQVKDTISKMISHVKEDARAEADKIVKDAEEKAKQIRDAAAVAADKAKKEGYATADKLVSETKDPFAKVAAKEASKKLKKETDEKANKIIKDADEQAKKVTDEARKKADAMTK